MKRIICSNPSCTKLFAELIDGNVLVVGSTTIQFAEDIKDTAKIEILCHKCKRKTMLIFK